MFGRMYLCLRPQFTNHRKYCKISKYEYLVKVGGDIGRADGENGKNMTVSFPHGYFVRPLYTEKPPFQTVKDIMSRVVCRR